jgi:hypothetical protein
MSNEFVFALFIILQRILDLTRSYDIHRLQQQRRIPDMHRERDRKKLQSATIEKKNYPEIFGFSRTNSGDVRKSGLKRNHNNKQRNYNTRTHAPQRHKIKANGILQLVVKETQQNRQNRNRNFSGKKAENSFDSHELTYLLNQHGGGLGRHLPGAHCEH